MAELTIDEIKKRIADRGFEINSSTKSNRGGTYEIVELRYPGKLTFFANGIKRTYDEALRSAYAHLPDVKISVSAIVSSEGPKCPRCETKLAAEDPSDFDENGYEISCECGANYRVSPYCSWFFTCTLVEGGRV